MEKIKKVTRYKIIIIIIIDDTLTDTHTHYSTIVIDYLSICSRCSLVSTHISHTNLISNL